jgi:glycosyltransferase involved in cell wall biosynthesis
MLGYGASVFCWLPRVFGTQVWINMDGLEWARAKWNWIARCYLRCAEAIALLTPDRIIADAATIKTNLQSRYKRLPICDVIPYGCEVVSEANADELAGFGLHPGSYYLVLCRFEPENHVREIVEGFLQSNSQGRLVLVGDYARNTPYVQSLKAYKDERLLFAGPVYDQPKVQALRFFCRAYLHGHSVGGTNPSLLEAMGCGNAVVAHDNIFNREVLGNSALFFSGLEAVSGAVESVDSERVDIAGMKANVIARVKRFYTWDRIADHYCELLSLVSSESRSGREVIHCAPLLPNENTTV